MSSNHVLNHLKLKNMSSIADLCQGLVETEKSIIYPLVDRLIQLILTLPVSTITTEQILYLVILILPPLINNPNSAPASEVSWSRISSVHCFEEGFQNLD
jgi:hypothetical protein